MTEIPTLLRDIRDHIDDPEYIKLLRPEIEAALAALPSTTDEVRVTVRELEWHPIVLGSTSSVADASFGEYTVEHYTEAATGDGWLAIYEDNRKLGYFGTEAAAKSACAEDRTARILASLNISKVEPVAREVGAKTEAVIVRNGPHIDVDWWRYGQHLAARVYEPMMLPLSSGLADVLAIALEQRPGLLASHPDASPTGVRDDALDRDELLAITEHLLMLADIDDPDPAEPDCTDLCGTRVCDQLGCVVSKWRRVRT